MTEANNKKPDKDALHRERSRFLDAFAALEEALDRQPKPTVDEALLKEIKALRLIRNDIVHAQLKFAQFDGELHAIAVNSQDIAKPARQGRLLNLSDFQTLSGDLGRLKNGLKTA